MHRRRCITAPKTRSCRWIGTAAAMLCGLAMLATAQIGTIGRALAQSSTTLSLAEVEANWDRFDTEQKFAALDQIVAAADYATAARLIDRVSASKPIERDQIALFRGLIVRGLGRHAEAVEIFRTLLAARPDYARVRLELANTLAVMREDESARHHFELLLGGAASNPMLDQVVRSHINTIDARKRWDFTSYLTLAPSSNLNQGSAARVVDVNGIPFQLADANVKKSGIGLFGGVQAGYRQPVTDTVDLLVSGGALGKLYRDHGFDDAVVSVSAGPRWNFGRGYVGLYATGESRWLGHDALSRGWGGLLSSSYQLTPANIVYADLACGRRLFDNDWHSINLNYQDGRTCSVFGRYDHHLDTRTYLRVLGGAGQERTGRTHLDNDSRSIGAGVYREIPFGISVYFQALYTHLAYRDLYPGFDLVRRDSRGDLSVNLTKRDLNLFGFAPMLQYTYTINASTVPIHKYDAHGINLTLSKRF